ncbi:MAG: DUF4147 domain-containing protein [Planctomycetaceae bacterium]|nr:DUF4147 domain-containing protein [Planctomycetaceae bacterium]
MTRNLRNDMLTIWRAGVDGVDVRRLVGEHLRVEKDRLVIGEAAYPLAGIQRITVIGAGKATANMASVVEQVLAEQIDAGMVAGWVNIPESCEVPLRVIRQHVARPAGVNEPTEAGVFGTRQMLTLIEETNRALDRQGVPLSQHLVLCLISGGGSALMPLPEPGVTLEQKLAVTRFLSASGATINEINTVRKQLSGVKGGRLKRHCRGTTLVGLILSDVLGDPLDVIASGPTVDNTTTALDAIKVLEKYGFDQEGFGLQASGFRGWEKNPNVNPESRIPKSEARNYVIGNNATAVDAAGMEAVHRGYSPVMLCATQSEGDVETLAEHFVDVIRKAGDSNTLSDCLISGGEPTVKLVPESQRGLGGRNQQLVLSVICRLFSDETWLDTVRGNPDACPFAFLSGGTDGEDGPTDAAGAFFDGSILHHIARSGIDPYDYLKRNDAYHFFEQFDALVTTGPTGTNVCDIRVLVTKAGVHSSFSVKSTQS